MIKKTILIIAILTSFLSYGQYDWTPGKMVLKNGDTLRGLFKIPIATRGLLSIPKSKLGYKKDKKGIKKKFDKNKVDKVFFWTSDTNIGYFEYVPISNKKMTLLKLISNGKVKLYTRIIKIGVEVGFQNDYNTLPQKKVEKKKEYYLIRENEKVATRVFIDPYRLSRSFKGNLRSFKSSMKKYFSDCPELLTYIDDDLYRAFDVAHIVDDYNLLCE